MNDVARFEGSLLGLAIGDALGHPTEFMSLRAIHDRFGERGITELTAAGRHPAGTFTDDTQMTIAVARALIRRGGGDLEAAMTCLGDEFVAWARSPLNNRAPGGTCLRGCRSLRDGVEWRRAGVADSKGCGAAMRAAPLGLFFYDDDARLVRWSAAQSSLTHRHPTGIASSVAAAAAVAHAMKGSLDGTLEATRAAVERLDAALLVEVGCTPELAEAIGNREMLRALDSTRDALPEETDDVCKLLGGAWIGEEAVATALWCAYKGGTDFAESVRRGATSSGDSDSIACIAGSITGALVGLDGIPERYRTGVETPEVLLELARALHLARTQPTPHLPALDPFGAEAPSAPSEDSDHV
jgi:ADP-ribosylglycohydrolase